MRLWSITEEILERWWEGRLGEQLEIWARNWVTVSTVMPGSTLMLR